MKSVGTIAMGVKCPIIRMGDNVKNIVLESVKKAYDETGLKPEDGDIIGITESVIARAYGNYATLYEIKESVEKLYNNEDSIVILGPIYSRNRFATCLRGIASAFKNVVIFMPDTDEVGNPGWREHPFTGIIYSEYYKVLCEEAGCESVVVTKNLADVQMSGIHNLLIASIHMRNADMKEAVESRLFSNIHTLCDILSDKCEYGLLGSNKSDENSVKLFPNVRKTTQLVYSLQHDLDEALGVKTEVICFGDGAFKSPFHSGVSIWELADPVVSVANTYGLNKMPNEVKIKYLADGRFCHLCGTELSDSIKKEISNMEKNSLVGDMNGEGTTPRMVYDLVGSLMDLITGSGSKGTPITLVKNYFKNYSND